MKMMSAPFLCPAIDPVWVGIDPAAFAVMSRKHQSKLMRQGRKELNKMSKEQGTQEAYSDYLQMRKSQVENIIELPLKAKEHNTTALDEAAKAVIAVDAVRQADETFADMALDLDLEPPVAPVKDKKVKVVLLLSDSDRYVQIRDRAKRESRALSEFDYDWLGEYYQSSTGKLYLKLEGDLRKKYGMASQERAGL